MNSGQTAKIIIASSLITTLIIAGMAFVVSDDVISYLKSEVTSSTPKSEPVRFLPNDQQIVATIERVNPAVVSVIVTKEVPVYERYYETRDPLGLFGGYSVPRVRENGTEQREVGGGSGFIVSNDGTIVTNRHVVEDEEALYSVLLNDGTAYDVDVLARDSHLDIAILKISESLESSLTHVTFGDSESLRLGETVIAIGNALAEFRNSVSVGVVSGLSRSIVASDSMGRSEQLDHVIQTDAAINPGNSGGPLLNIDGEVVGVNVATSRGADNIGFALPSHIVKSVVNSVREHGEIIRPFLGVRYTMITERIAKQNNLPVTYGALVIRGETDEELAVAPGSPADKAGIAENAIILAIDGEDLRDRDMATVLRGKNVGQEIEIRLLQDGEERTVKATLDKAP